MDRITLNNNQCGGRPCIRAMRIRVKDVLDLLAAGVEETEIFETIPNLKPKTSGPVCDMPPPKRSTPSRIAFRVWWPGGSYWESGAPACSCACRKFPGLPHYRAFAIDPRRSAGRADLFIWEPPIREILGTSAFTWPLAGTGVRGPER